MRGLEGGVEGCISTPMPNHLSTCLSLPLNHIRVVKKEKSGVEQMRRMDEMMWMSG